MNHFASNRAGGLRWLAVGLGVLSFVAVLTEFNFTDTDLWAKLALGAHVWLQGSVLAHDVFAFTPVLPEYIDHEWGAGAIFYACLKWFGPNSLMSLKIVLATGSLVAAMLAGRRLGCGWNSLLALAIPCGACILPAYVPVLRSHTFTFFFFGATLLCLEEIRAGKKWPAFILPVIMLVWVNVHGGFVAGLGAVGVYTAFAFLDLLGERLVTGTRGAAAKRFWLMLLVVTACAAVTLVNPYGLKFWTYLIPALLNKRPQITEWQAMSVFGGDVFIGFRVLFVLVIIVLLVAWRRTGKKSWPGLAMLLLTAFITWRSRRHAPFFGVATLAFVGPFAVVAYQRLLDLFPKKLADRVNPAFVVVLLYSLLALYVATNFLPRSSFQVLSPVGIYPVREVDILSRAEAEGNLAVPFSFGSYATWRLFPLIKVSMDGRYEAAYPESTFQLNENFFGKTGTNWDRLVNEYPVDFVIMDLREDRLRPEDLQALGYVLVWRTEAETALLVREKYAAKFRQVVAGLPATTINPLDAAIPETWWTKKTGASEPRP